MDTYKSAVRLNVMLKRRSLGVVRKSLVIAVGKDDGCIPLQIRLGEDCGIVGSIHGKAALCAHFPDSINAGGNVVVYVALAVRRVVACIDQHPRLWLSCLRTSG